jgi:hypothetical protein
MFFSVAFNQIILLAILILDRFDKHNTITLTSKI